MINCIYQYAFDSAATSTALPFLEGLAPSRFSYAPQCLYATKRRLYGVSSTRLRRDRRARRSITTKKFAALATHIFICTAHCRFACATISLSAVSCTFHNFCHDHWSSLFFFSFSIAFQHFPAPRSFPHATIVNVLKYICPFSQALFLCLRTWNRYMWKRLFVAANLNIKIHKFMCICVIMRVFLCDPRDHAWIDKVFCCRSSSQYIPHRISVNEPLWTHNNAIELLNIPHGSPQCSQSKAGIAVGIHGRSRATWSLFDCYGNTSWRVKDAVCRVCNCNCLSKIDTLIGRHTRRGASADRRCVSMLRQKKTRRVFIENWQTNCK